MLALMYQEWRWSCSVALTISVDVIDPSILRRGRRLDGGFAGLAHVVDASATHSTCCSIDTGNVRRTDGLCGPVMAKRLGKPATAMPR